MLRNRYFIFAAILLACNVCVDAKDLVFSYDNGHMEQDCWGTGRRERYDVGIVLEAAKLGKCTINSVDIPVRGTDKMSEFDIWVSSDLYDTGEFADLYSTRIDVPAVYDKTSGMIHFDFPEPVSMGEHSHLYVGCSFSLTSLNSEAKEPLVTVAGAPFQSYVRTKSIGRWTDMGLYSGRSFGMQVSLAGCGRYAGAFDLSEPLYVETGKDIQVATRIINTGSEGIKTCRYSGSIAEHEFHGELTVPQGGLEGRYGDYFDVVLPIPALERDGDYTLTLCIDRIDGNLNETASAVSLPVSAFAFLPVKTPLVEEYTSMSCGYCPRGTAALEIMKERHGDNFIALSYHMPVEDPLAFFSEVPIGKGISLPAAQIDRGSIIDPYFGETGDVRFGLDDCWLAAASSFTPISLTLAGHIEGDAIRLEAETQPVIDIKEGDYRLEFFLVADGLHDEVWRQKNYLSGSDAYKGLEGLDKYVNASGSIQGPVYDDVVVCRTEMQPDPKLVVEDVNAYSRVKTVQRFVIPPVASSASVLKGVVAIVDNESGRVFNAACVTLKDTSIDTLSPEADVVTVEYYSLIGERLSSPSGICICRYIHKDGSVTVRKIIM